MSRLKRLISEIHRRSLWQILVIYLGVSWGVLEAAALFRDEFGLPGWLVSAALGLLIAGLVVVLVLAFVPEPATSPEEPHELHLASARRRHLLTWRRAATIFVVALAAWGVVATGWYLLAGKPEPEQMEAPEETRKSIAVLPFDNLSPDPENEYFADGMHDEVIAHLSKIADLKVISRTSVMEYKGRSENLRTIADELGVTNILEGTVRRADGRVRITTQLLDALADEHLWTEVYDRNLSDVFAVQSDVAQRVATALRAKLTPAERERIEERPTESLEAYEFYLQGNVYASGGPTLRALEPAQQMYERAVEVDPQFALAYARLSSVHSKVYHQGFDRTAERLRQAQEAVNRAFELRPDLPEAHVALGHYYYRGFRDYERAMAALDVAEEALPGNLDVLNTKSWIAKRQGRFEEAISLLREARRLDPRNWEVCREIALNLEYGHKYVEAAAHHDTVLALAPHQLYSHLAKARLRLYERGETDSLRSALDYLVSRSYEYRGEVFSDRWYVEFFDRDYAAVLGVLAWAEHDAFDLQESYNPTPLLAGFVHLAVGDSEKAQAAFDSARRVLEVEVQEYPEDERRLVALGLAYAGLGRKDEAIRAGLNALDLPYPKTDLLHRAPTVRALVWIYAMLGDQDAAIDQLESYVALPSEWSVQAVLRDPRFDPLRDHPRFQALLAK